MNRITLTDGSILLAVGPIPFEDKVAVITDPDGAFMSFYISDIKLIEPIE